MNILNTLSRKWLFAAASSASIALFVTGCSRTDPPPPRIADDPRLRFVAVTDSDIKAFGTFPIDRNYYARVIHESRGRGAKAVVLKFFIDRDTPADAKLAEAIKELPTYLQQGIKVKPAQDASQDGVMQASADIMVATLRQAATNVGFVEFRLTESNDRIEMAALVDGNTMKSLQLETAEEVVGKPAEFLDHKVVIGEKTFAMDDQGRAICPYTKQAIPRTIPLQDVLSTGSGQVQLDGAVVILGYDASDSPTISYSDSVKVTVHHAFYQQVACLLGFGGE